MFKFILAFFLRVVSVLLIYLNLFRIGFNAILIRFMGQFSRFFFSFLFLSNFFFSSKEFSAPLSQNVQTFGRSLKNQ